MALLAARIERTRVRRAALLGVLIAVPVLGLPATAAATWNQPWTGVSATSGGISAPGTLNLAVGPDIAVLEGVPYIAWTEIASGDPNEEIRVARLNGGTWEQPWAGVSGTSGGINQSTTKDAIEPDLEVVGGVLYVAWRELDADGNWEVRVARLNGTTWSQPWTGANNSSGAINDSTTQQGESPSLADVGGVPYVAFRELDGSNYELRVKRLNGNSWDEPWTGVTATSGGINQSSAQDGNTPALAVLGGVPHVAWTELDGTNLEVRVARLAGTTWEQPWTGVSATSGGVNQSTTRSGLFPSLVVAGAKLYVGWLEDDGDNQQARVARLDGLSWGQPWTGVSDTGGGVNHDPDQMALSLKLGEANGTPYVTWTEFDGTNPEARVARLDDSRWDEPWTGVTDTSGAINQSTTGTAEVGGLTEVGGVLNVVWSEGAATIRDARVEPEFSEVSALPTDTGATLITDLKTYGFVYPTGFAYGPGLASSTSFTRTSGDPDTIVKQVTGLSPSANVPFRPIATAGPGPVVLGPSGAFTTRPANGPGPPGATGPQGSPGPTGATGRPGRDARVRCRIVRSRRVRCRVTLVRPTANRRARASLRRHGRVYALGHATLRHGVGRLVLRPVRALRPGRYTLKLVARGLTLRQRVTVSRR